jgi:hypothetical protein
MDQLFVQSSWEYLNEHRSYQDAGDIVLIEVDAIVERKLSEKYKLLVNCV